MATIHMKRNDTGPSLAGTLKDADGDPVNITGASVLFKMRKKGTEVFKFSSAATVVDGSLGTVRYDWAASDTDTAGSYEGEFEATLAGGVVQTFPNNGYIPIEILPDVA